MNYELAKKLKDAGFKQNWLASRCPCGISCGQVALIFAQVSAIIPLYEKEKTKCGGGVGSARRVGAGEKVR